MKFSSFVSEPMGTVIILIFLTTLAEKSIVGAAGIDVHIVFDHQETFEVRDDRDIEWSREKRSLDDQEWHSRRLTWSADALAGNELEEDTDMDNDKEKDEEKDYEVVDLASGGKAGLLNKPWVERLRSMTLLPILVVGALLLVVFYYQVCLKKKGCTFLCEIFPCCACLHPKKMGRKGANKYMPGVIIHEDENYAEYYEVTEREREALYDVVGSVA